MDMTIVKELMDTERSIGLMFKPRGYMIVDSGMSLDQDDSEMWRDITLENQEDEDEFYCFSFSNKGNLIIHEEDVPQHIVSDLKGFLLDS